MNERRVPGVRFAAVRFTPDSGLYDGQMCEGATLMVTDRASLQSMLLGIEIARRSRNSIPAISMCPK